MILGLLFILEDKKHLPAFRQAFRQMCLRLVHMHRLTNDFAFAWTYVDLRNFPFTF